MCDRLKQAPHCTPVLDTHCPEQWTGQALGWQVLKALEACTHI